MHPTQIICRTKERPISRHRMLPATILIKAPSTPATMSNEISSFLYSRNKLNMFNLFRLCRKDEISFDIVVETGPSPLGCPSCLEYLHLRALILLKTLALYKLCTYLLTYLHCCQNGNNFEATFVSVEKIVQLVAFDIVAGVDGA